MNLDVSCVLCSLFCNQEMQHGIKLNADFSCHAHMCCRFRTFSGRLSRLQSNHIAMSVSWADLSRCSSWSRHFTISFGWIEWFVTSFSQFWIEDLRLGLFWWLCKRSCFDAWVLIWPWKISHSYKTLEFLLVGNLSSLVLSHQFSNWNRKIGLKYFLHELKIRYQ